MMLESSDYTITLQMREEDEEGYSHVHFHVGEEITFHHLAAATQFLMCYLAQESDDGYEKALEDLVQGAMSTKMDKAKD